MKAYLLTILFAISTVISTAVQAEAEKNVNIGLASYALVIGYDDPFITDDEYSGIGVSALYAISNNVAFRGTLYSIEHDELPGLDNTGYDLVAYWGTGFIKRGFKAYIGGGFFSESQEFLTFKDTFSGLQINGGIGYNWDVMALDFVLGIRDPSDYEEFLQDTPDERINAAAVTGSLILSARF